MSKLRIKQVNIGPVSGINIVPLWNGVEFDDTPISYDSGANHVNIAGDFSAVTKRFLINHPTKPGFQLQHGNLEGPEHGVYVRGKSTSKHIKLPDYWEGLVDADSITVQLTPIGCQQNLYVKSATNTEVIIGGSHNPEYFYLIQGTRKDVDPLDIEIARK